MTLEEALKSILSLASVPDNSSEFAQWHNPEVAEDSYFWTRGECEHRTRYLRALEICRLNAAQGLTSPSPYVRRMTQLSLLKIGSEEYAKERAEFIVNCSRRMMEAMTEAKWTELSRKLTDDFFRDGIDKSLKENGL